VNDEEIVASMVGCTIIAAELKDDSTPDSWGACEYITLTLSDGRVVLIEGWGHDAWGVTVGLAEPTDSLEAQ
jgi:hypothetical protein